MALAFLGSSLGNLGRYEQDEFIALLADTSRRRLPPRRASTSPRTRATLEAAYDDAAGVTAGFTRNLFARMNRELGTNVPRDSVRHVAIYNERLERIEIYAEVTEEATAARGRPRPHLPLGPRRAHPHRAQLQVPARARPTAAIARHGFVPVWNAADDGARLRPVPLPPLAPPRRPRAARAARWEALLTSMRARTQDLWRRSATRTSSASTAA
jgi:hypothetical protein